MAGIDALTHGARVANIHPFWNRAVMQLPRQAVRRYYLASDPGLSVVADLVCCDPQPTRIGLVDLTPKPNLF